VVDLSGELNAFAEDALSRAFQDAEAAGGSAVLLNFSLVEYINSTGIALIVSLLTRAREAGRTLIVFGLSEHYREIFQITRLSDFVQIFPDEASALDAALGNP
jgi:anti-anti-sigma factor